MTGFATAANLSLQYRLHQGSWMGPDGLPQVHMPIVPSDPRLLKGAAAPNADCLFDQPVGAHVSAGMLP